MMRAVSAAMGRRGIAMMFEQGMDGIRKAAAATLTSSEMEKRFCSDLIIRRNYSTTTSLAAVAEEKEIDKSLYLCFEEEATCRRRIGHSIQSVRLSHVLAPPPPPPPPPQQRAIRRRDLLDSESDDFDDDDDDDDELVLHQVHDEEKNILELEQVAVRRGPMSTRIPDYVKSTVIEGSKIVLFGGLINDSLSNVCGFETRRDPTVSPRRAFKPLPMIKNSLFLVEVDGKLYRFGPGYIYMRTKHSHYWNVMCEFFEVFDDKDGEGKWLPLDVPPTDPRISAGLIRDPDPQFTYAVAGTNILIWSIHHPGVGVSRFDVSHPEKGWTQLNSDLGDCIPSLGHAQILFLKLHPGRDRGFLMFCSHTAYHGKPNLQVFLVSHDCDSLKPIESVPLPQMALDFRGHESRLFHIQGQKFGLALFRPECYYCELDYYEKVRVAVITYEYQAITTHDDHDESESLENVKYKLLSTCCLEYTPSGRPCDDITPVGAHVL